MKVEDVKQEMQLLEGNFADKDVMNLYFWWRGTSRNPWKMMVKEMEATGVEEMIARYEIERGDV